ncbi:hypothetical protein RHGRI_007594 [Rhododendron griersonianum]|uniref:PB1-like domain-containing protein n=1 Tax=Rhododendron griersonianum TaxID=479676 RepID=A0AAV6KY39_9ERIC|nr:hypothetical protein RHGRI_007594 [Rhododendron griersonianum]
MGDGRIQLNIKFGRKFEGNPFHSYIDGDICYSRVIPYEFSYADLVTVMQEIGCYPWRSFFYLRPGHGIENGLAEITSDVDMTEMFILYEGDDKDIECFVTHLDVEEDDKEGLGWEGEELGLEDLENAQNADEDEEEEEEEEEEIRRGALQTRETSPCPLIPTSERMPRGATSAGTSQRVVTRGLANAQRRVARGVPRGVPTSAAITNRVLTRGLANAQREGVARGVASGRGQRGTIGAPRTIGTDVTRGRGVARGLVVSATIGDASVVGTSGARTTRSTTFGGVRAAGARRDRDGATRTGGTSGGAETVEADTMIRHGKKIYLKSHQSQQGWKITRIGDGVFSSQATKGFTKGSTQ